MVEEWLPRVLCQSPERHQLDQHWHPSQCVVLDLASAHGVSEFERVLDMRRGLLQRRVEVETEAGVKVLLETERFISMTHPNRAAVKIALTPLSGVESLTLEPKLDGGITNEDTNWDDEFWRHVGHTAETTDGTSVLTNTTEKTGFTVSVAQALECDGAHWESRSEAKLVGLQCSFDASKPVEIVKHVGVVSSLHVESEQCPSEALREAKKARALGYEALKAEHEQAWEEIWALGDIEIEGDVEAQQAIRFNIFI